MAKEKTTQVFDTTVAKKVGEVKTGDKYFDKFTQFKSNVATRIVTMSIKDFKRLTYNPVEPQEVHDKKLDISKLHPPVIDIYGKQSVGNGRVLVAESQGVKEVPVLIIATKEGAIDWWLERKGLKKAKKTKE